jgi:hypothetical protein
VRCIVLTVPDAAGKRVGDVRRNDVRIRLQYGLSLVQRRVRIQRRRQQLRCVVRALFDSGELHRHLRRNELRIQLPNRVSCL